MTDHLQDAVFKMINARADLVGRVARVRYVDLLIDAVRHQVAGEIRNAVEIKQYADLNWEVALDDQASRIDPYRLDPDTGEWVIK